MNYGNNGAKYGIDQYRFARNFDLKDKSFTIAADGKNYTLSFTGRDKAAFDSGGGGQECDYECQKIEADTYFVRFGDSFAVLELGAGAATLILPGGYVFGAVAVPGKAPAAALHGFTDEMTGTGVRWVFGCYKFTDQVYFSTDKCRAAWSPKESEFAEYAAKYIKIKDGIFLVDVAGAVPEGVCAPAGCDRILMLQDYEHTMFTGCATGKSGAMMISGYGEFPDLE